MIRKHAHAPLSPSSLLSVLFAAFLPLAAATLHAQLSRQSNTTLKFPPEPQVSTGSYVLTNAFPGLTFDRPVAIASPPGETSRLFVAERTGRILVLNELRNPVPEVFLDLRDRVFWSSWEGHEPDARRAEGLTSFAFHPEFAANGRFFVTYTTVTSTSQGQGHHNRLSEFRASADRRSASPGSEIPYITQFDEGDGHNINDVHFGPDRYLYVAIGDEGDGNTGGDEFNNAQRIDKDFFSAILRIDVDKRAGNLAPNPHPAADTSRYSIPADNPFVGATSFLGRAVDPAKVRSEFFAVGLRNAWRISFDPLTGAIYEGDVGQHGREEINRIVKGGNYGWSFLEGSIAGPKAPAPSGHSFIEPLWEYSTGFGPDWGFSVTCGVVSRSSRFPGLYGHLLFADFVSGNLWAMNIDATPNDRPVWLLGQTGIASFGRDPRDGDALIVKHDAPGQIMRLGQPGSSAAFPGKLSQTGVFKDLRTLAPENGIYPFEVNLPFWSDNAIKRRWFSLPDVTADFGFRADQNWVLPPGAVWIKHFELELRPGDPASRRPVETRVLVRNSSGGYGLTYKWNQAGTDADLVSEQGENQSYTITENGKTRQQVWHFPSRQECLSCHTESGGFALSFNTAQLNRPVTHGAFTTNQIGALAGAGFLSSPPPGVHGLRKLAALDDATASRTHRLKSYLAANCAFCHEPGGSAQGNALWDARLTTPLSSAGIVHGQLFNSPDPNTRVIVPGRPDRSEMLKRISTLGAGRMPPIGSTVLDQAAIDLLTQWISQDATQFETFDQWSARVMGSVASPAADPDRDGGSNHAEYLAGTHPLQASSKLSLSARAQNGAFTLSFTQPPNRALLLESLTATGWLPVQSVQNEMNFPAAPLTRQISDSLFPNLRIYRLRILEP